MATVEDVRNYWNEHPLLSYELEAPGSPAFFDALDHAKVDDSDKFALGYWGFDSFRDKKLLDIGCGPGWVAMMYANGGANVTAVDLTPAAVELAKKHLAYKSVTADVREANAEQLPFADETFDVVVSSGVLHHTPDTCRAFREAARVLKAGRPAKITLYHKGILHSPALFWLVKLVMQAAGVKHPGADLGKKASNVDDFIRQYDGFENPVGIGKSTSSWIADLEQAGFRVDAWELHYFPKRFLPFSRFVPDWLHAFLDTNFGTMIYFDLTKK